MIIVKSYQHWTSNYVNYKQKKVTLLLEGNKSIMPETYKEISSLLSYLKNA